MERNTFLRDVVGNSMISLGEKDRRVVVVNADLMKTSRNHSFVSAFPERSFNVGIAEQFMISFSAGLAHEGFIPFAFSMAPFISMRACEQCRTDVAYSNLNVRMIATYAGVSGGISGATHWSIEDVGIMRSIPNMTILEPSDSVQAKKMLDVMLRHNGPIYMRISVEPVENIYDESYTFEIGKASVCKKGKDGAFICSGVVVSHAMEAANELKRIFGIDVRVVDMHTIKPIDKAAVVEAVKTGYVVVAQDHNTKGGLGDAVAEVMAEEGITCRYANVGISDKFVAMAHAAYLFRQFGYDSKGLMDKMLYLMGKKRDNKTVGESI